MHLDGDSRCGVVKVVFVPKDQILVTCNDEFKVLSGIILITREGDLRVMAVFIAVMKRADARWLRRRPGTEIYLLSQI